MNLFILSIFANVSAKDHCDKHCVKMILEITQLLYTAWWHGRTEVNWAECEFNPYKATHKNHPCAIWVRSQENHYKWALTLGFELCKEYTRRYNKTHKCFHHLTRLAKMGYPEKIQEENHKLNMSKRSSFNCPDGCEYFDCVINDDIFQDCAVYNTEGKLDCVETYRKYYKHKDFKMVWNKGKDETPSWFEN